MRRLSWAKEKTMAGILYVIAALLIIGWVISFVFSNIVSPLIHLLLVIGLLVLAYQFFTGRRRV